MGNSAGLIGWLVVAVVAPVAGVLGYRQVTQAPATPTAESRPAEARPTAPQATSNAVEAIRSPLLSELSEKCIPAVTQADFLRGDSPVQVVVVISGLEPKARELAEQLIKNKVETRLRQSRIPVHSDAQLPPIVQLCMSIDVGVIDTDQSFVAATELSANRLGFAPIAHGRFVGGMTTIWQKSNLRWAGPASFPTDGIDPLINQFIADYRVANP
ncbi:MAG TPA: hypothetical protein VD866_12970 [Urbifossiella sp.]|nr:hypothetical protein [Urbifossiella sp.]